MENQNTESGTASPHGDIGEVLRLFLRLGFTAFGGPAAHIAMMHDEVVVRRNWLDEQEFLDLVGATNLIPGPNSTELAIHLGYRRAGWRGMIGAGLCFILPAVLIVLFFAWAYVVYGSTPQGEALLYGIKPVVIAIVAQAILKLAPSALKSPLLWIVAATALALFLLGVNELIVLFGGAAVVVGLRALRNLRGASPVIVPFLAANTPLSTAGDSAPVTLWQLFLVFLKAGALLYGSGYVLLAFLRNDLVMQLGWLTDQQLLDAIAVGQFTPGPVFTTATFIGYVVAGVPGALVATVGIFLPSFLFVGLLTRIMPHLRRSEWSASFLDGVNATALALMAGVMLVIAGSALVDWITIAIALLAALMLFRFHINSAWLVLGGAIVGLIHAALA